MNGIMTLTTNGNNIQPVFLFITFMVVVVSCLVRTIATGKVCDSGHEFAIDCTVNGRPRTPLQGVPFARGSAIGCSFLWIILEPFTAVLWIVASPLNTLSMKPLLYLRSLFVSLNSLLYLCGASVLFRPFLPFGSVVVTRTSLYDGGSKLLILPVSSSIFFKNALSVLRLVHPASFPGTGLAIPTKTILLSLVLVEFLRLLFLTASNTLFHHAPLLNELASRNYTLL